MRAWIPNQLSFFYPPLPPQHGGSGMQQAGACIGVRAHVHVCASVCVCRWQGAATHRMAVGCGALSQDSPGPAERVPGVCLQEPREADTVGATARPPEPGASRGSAGADAAGRFQRTGCHDLSPHF